MNSCKGLTQEQGSGEWTLRASDSPRASRSGEVSMLRSCFGIDEITIQSKIFNYHTYNFSSCTIRLYMFPYQYKNLLQMSKMKLMVQEKMRRNQFVAKDHNTFRRNKFTIAYFIPFGWKFSKIREVKKLRSVKKIFIY